jgi:hypothetical protein
VRNRKLVGLLFASGAVAAHGANAQGSDVRPQSKSDVQTAVVLPTSSTCERMIAFDVKLAESPSASTTLVKITRTNVAWSVGTTVSEFVPARAMPPFSRFFLHETPDSHKVSWAMGAAFFASQELAREAGAQYARWYASALGASSRAAASGDRYLILKDELALTVEVDETAVRVSCEHRPTQRIAVYESLRHASGDR